MFATFTMMPTRFYIELEMMCPDSLYDLIAFDFLDSSNRILKIPSRVKLPDETLLRDVSKMNIDSSASSLWFNSVADENSNDPFAELPLLPSLINNTKVIESGNDLNRVLNFK